MKSEFVMALVFRILGLLLGLQAIAFIPGVMLAASMPLSPESTIGSHILPQMLGLGLSLIVAYVLLRHGCWLARRIVSADEYLELANVAIEKADTIPVFRLFLRIVGALVVALAIPELAGHGLGHVMIYKMSNEQVWTQIAPGAVKLAIGIYLLRGGPHLVHFAYGCQALPKEET